LETAGDCPSIKNGKVSETSFREGIFLSKVSKDFHGIAPGVPVESFLSQLLAKCMIKYM
jgi:hypothetical protein